MELPLDQFRQLPVSERLVLVEQLWDSIHESRGLLQQWHREEAARRAKQLDADPSIAITEQEVWQRVDQLLNE